MFFWPILVKTKVENLKFTIGLFKGVRFSHSKNMTSSPLFLFNQTFGTWKDLSFSWNPLFPKWPPQD